MIEPHRYAERMLVFIAALTRGRYPRSVPALAAEARISRATAYRWVRDIERVGTLPLRREADPTSPSGRAMLVGVDWPSLAARGGIVWRSNGRA